MKICTMCGSRLQDTFNSCPNCGNPNILVQQPSINNQMYGQMPGPYVQQPKDKGNVGWGILGVFSPLIGLILYCVWKNSKPGNAKCAGIGAIIGFILGIALRVILGIVLSLTY